MTTREITLSNKTRWWPFRKGIVKTRNSHLDFHAGEINYSQLCSKTCGKITGQSPNCAHFERLALIALLRGSQHRKNMECELLSNGGTVKNILEAPGHRIRTDFAAHFNNRLDD
jgi:hypothetical protein